ncbi:MAG: hypothetical protein A2725_02550 [Candidatus Magasanikbacteria bacterium RIFCSPHIGHO2_01_FULL_33_34]|uniref:Uncharacterized protein n=1 Tax=Candidatus Magasanikbacteria bacterium RIFCSPHIGHO2_01_FULL_33_34 TaxID=1798671 RepID=A0A1F6LKD9_9BACT|nr:MAG: hypothetical protein A2725_02550 [Candidatus Magasanikbacteria bacterium RIFCSPHIGHO2_01_FULL_33_34]OGH65601.1 MAG: hypothetical protein A3B83_01850 [Candidatus Magasanikbacteria bacterium RIFCSPHIGHO2_02_FULL_33_17]OGH75810.1 MAG: hypothetical protein A3A89_02745 [Candidatus Magasanikbacteria bacterium RIFCSPLOWO2_01_FULL_33_34]OGH81334.1 MAG: hypothetical protein A3F93_02105 [Candidatus Magasanikbacteria bacterium RIFCSPLOWO2_12_FULL_34_7]
MNEPSSKEHVMTNILFIEDDGSRSPYDPNIHKTRVNKFLYWDTLLITGPQEYHNTLYKCYINNKDDQQLLSASGILGAGNCAYSKVVSWSSLGYRIKTPEDLKQTILDLLQMEY